MEEPQVPSGYSATAMRKLIADMPAENIPHAFYETDDSPASGSANPAAVQFL